MANLLFLAHRLPYPPDKGDKVRSYNLLRYLLARHRVYLGTFIDDPADRVHLPVLQALCAEVCAPILSPSLARVGSLRGLVTGEALTLPYYRHRQLSDWVAAVSRRERIDATVVFSSAMAQYAPAGGAGPVLVDLVDVDSAKWTAYADAHRGPMAWIYRREGRTLQRFEADVAARSTCTFLATDKEAALFRSRAPHLGDRVVAMFNGVDTDFFAPDPCLLNPYADNEPPLVFTGAMDYWPNVDAVIYFVSKVLPLLRRKRPDLRLHIVGRNPNAAVQALANESVSVSGTVPDVRPYLQHAAVVVAPLRLARGIQNKILEAMAMGRPVVAARECVAALDHRPDDGLYGVDEPDEYALAIEGLLADPLAASAAGADARMCVVRHYRWDARLSVMDQWLA